MMLSDPKNNIQAGLDKNYVRDSRKQSSNNSSSLLQKGSTNKSTFKMSQPS